MSAVGAAASRPLVIAGMHRSGTSLAGRVLHLAGVDMGDRLLAESPDVNPHGFFEDIEVLEVHQQVLRASVPPDEPGLPDWGWTPSGRLELRLSDEHRRRLAAVVERRRAAGRPWGFKEPRTTLLLGLWAELVPDALFLLVHRAPQDVVSSALRLGLQELEDHPWWAPQVWLAYNRALLDFARRAPERCLVLPVDALGSSAPQLAALLREHGAGVPSLEDGEALSGVVAAATDGSLLARHPAGGPLATLLRAEVPGLAQVASELEQRSALPVAEHEGDTRAAAAEAELVERLQGRREAGLRLAGEHEARALRRAQDARLLADDIWRAKAEAEGQVTMLREQVAQLERELHDERVAGKAVWEAKLDAEARGTGLRAAAAAVQARLEEHVAGLEAQVAGLEAQLDVERRARAAAEARAAALEQSRSWTLTRPLRAAAEIARRGRSRAR